LSWSCAHVATLVWHNATMPVVATLLAWWWFTSYPMQLDLTMAFVIVPHPSSGFSTGVGSRSHVVGSPTGREAGDHDLEPRGRGPSWLGWL
jgi:hypothetical protein